MKARLTAFFLVAVAVVMLIPAAFAQYTASVKGTIKDEQGKPMPNATVELQNGENGQKYKLKTNNKGEYFSLGIQPGKYKVTLEQDGKPIFQLTNVPIGLEQQETVVDIDLQQERANQAQQGGTQPAAKGGKGQPQGQPQLTEEQKKRIEAAQKEQMTVKTLNEKLAQASAAEQAGNPDQAVQILTQATQIDATRDLLWARLGDAYKMSGAKQTDKAQQSQDYAQAADAYQKAIQIKPNADYYNNLGEMLGKSGKPDDAVKAYTTAAQLDPPNAGKYYFNMGAVETNTGKVDDAIQAFDKAIAADPNRADAYYWKGVNLLGKAKLEGNKMVAPPGTAEAFNKYLELQPTGQFAEPAKQMLTQMGAPIETSFGKGKKKSK
jgi:tetratricopeptide (TPR) repeat protein